MSIPAFIAMTAVSFFVGVVIAHVLDWLYSFVPAQ